MDELFIVLQIARIYLLRFDLMDIRLKSFL